VIKEDFSVLARRSKAYYGNGNGNGSICSSLIAFFLLIFSSSFENCDAIRTDDHT
jgi:hypothetical protein